MSGWWIYLPGLVVALVIGGRWLGQQWYIQTAKIGTPDPQYHYSNVTYDSGDRAEAMAACVGLVLLCAGLWPLAGFVFYGARRGNAAAKQHVETERLLAKANAELELIRQQEGWKP